MKVVSNYSQDDEVGFGSRCRVAYYACAPVHAHGDLAQCSVSGNAPASECMYVVVSILVILCDKLC